MTQARMLKRIMQVVNLFSINECRQITVYLNSGVCDELYPIKWWSFLTSSLVIMSKVI